MFLALILFHLAAMQSLEVKSPLYQHLPNCENYFRLSKKTDKKVGVCVLAKDEEGFLSEFVAYYVVHGIDHVIIYDDNSTDSSIKELEPWIRAGFASVRLAGTWNGWLGDSAKTWGQQMKQKKMMERNCKMTLYDWGYHYHISVDVDEYEVPFRLNVTLADEIDRMFTQNPTRGTFNVNKLQFNALPHILEPFDKLTIEAYQNRFHGVNKFNPKKSLMQKSVYRIRSPLYSNETLKFVLECCTFHSCKQGPIQICWELQKTELSKIFHAHSHLHPLTHSLTQSLTRTLTRTLLLTHSLSSTPCPFERSLRLITTHRATHYQSLTTHYVIHSVVPSIGLQRRTRRRQ